MDKETHNKLIEETNEIIDKILDDGIQVSNVDNLFKIVDIQKDAYKIKCLKEGNEMNYGEYGRNYNNYGRYNARGYDTKYRGERYLDDMSMDYGRYQESREQANRGNYGAKEDAIKSLDYMLKSVVDFMKMLKEDATSQEEMQLIQQYARKISEM